jgi:hypothetical protein
MYLLWGKENTRDCWEGGRIVAQDKHQLEGHIVEQGCQLVEHIVDWGNHQLVGHIVDWDNPAGEHIVV